MVLRISQRLFTWGQRYLAVRLGLIVLLISGISWVSLPAAAALPCRQTAHHRICILKIERSAKNFWEYRAVVKIDDEVRPMEVYNCRDRLRVKTDGLTVPFEPDGAGVLICSLFRR